METPTTSKTATTSLPSAVVARNDDRIVADNENKNNKFVYWKGDWLRRSVFDKWCGEYYSLLNTHHTTYVKRSCIVHESRQINDRPELRRVYCKVLLNSSTFPDGLDHVTAFYEICFTQSQWTSYLEEVDEFEELATDFWLAECGPYSFNFCIRGDLMSMINMLKLTALVHGEPLINVAPKLVWDRFDDSQFVDYHCTWQHA